MMTMLEDGVFQAVLGVTSLEEVFRVVSSEMCYVTFKYQLFSVRIFEA